MVKIDIVPKGTMTTFSQICPQKFGKTADIEAENGIFLKDREKSWLDVAI